MGKGYYFGGGTKIGIYDKNLAVIKKIHKKLHNEISSRYVSLESCKEFFDGYDLEELEEIYEDVVINYNGRRELYIRKIKEYVKNK